MGSGFRVENESVQDGFARIALELGSRWFCKKGLF